MNKFKKVYSEEPSLDGEATIVKKRKINSSPLNDCISQLSLLKVAATHNILKIGQILYDVKDKELYLEAYDTFEEFIATPELSFSRGTAYKAMKVWFVFIEQYAIPENDILDIDSDKLYKIAGYVDNNNIEEMIEKARHLSRSDLNDEINELKGLPPKPTTLEVIQIFLDKFPLYVPMKEGIIAWENFKKDRQREAMQ